MGLREHIARAKVFSDAELDAIEREPVTYESVYTHLKNFISYRYLIDDDGFWSDDVTELATYSLEKMLAERSENESISDLSMNCTGASSVETKYALLLITIRKRLDLAFEPVMAAELDTVPLLAQEVCRQLEHRGRTQ